MGETGRLERKVREQGSMRCENERLSDTVSYTPAILAHGAHNILQQSYSLGDPSALMHASTFFQDSMPLLAHSSGFGSSSLIVLWKIS